MGLSVFIALYVTQSKQFTTETVIEITGTFIILRNHEYGFVDHFIHFYSTDISDSTWSCSMASIVDKDVTINSSETLGVEFWLSQVNELGSECTANFAASKPCNVTEFLYNASPSTYDYGVYLDFLAANDKQFYFTYYGTGGWYTFSTG